MIEVAVEKEVRSATKQKTAWFEWTMIILSSWLAISYYVDAWAHLHGFKIEPLITEWHISLYTSYLATLAFLVGSFFYYRFHLPTGYHISLIGTLIFLVCGAADTIFQTTTKTYGIETFSSPAWLLVQFGTILIFSGPIVAAWQRPSLNSRQWLFLLLALGYVLALINLMLLDVHPFGHTYATLTNPNLQTYQFLALSLCVIQAALLMGMSLLIMRRWQLPIGSLTLIFTFSTTFIALISDRTLSTGPLPIILAVGLSGLVADLLRYQWHLTPQSTNFTKWRLFSVIVPFIMFSAYFIVQVTLTTNFWWSPNACIVVILATSAIGWLLSFLILPPKQTWQEQ